MLRALAGCTLFSVWPPTACQFHRCFARVSLGGALNSWDSCFCEFPRLFGWRLALSAEPAWPPTSSIQHPEHSHFAEKSKELAATQREALQKALESSVLEFNLQGVLPRVRNRIHQLRSRLRLDRRSKEGRFEISLPRQTRFRYRLRSTRPRDPASFSPFRISHAAKARSTLSSPSKGYRQSAESAAASKCRQESKAESLWASIASA